MRIVTSKDVPHINKPGVAEVWYYLFDEYEVHYNEQDPKSVQDWHSHQKLWEVLIILEGKLVAKWREGGTTKEQVVSKGDVVEVGRSMHTFENKSDEVVRFLVLKMVLTGENHRELFKEDKVLMEDKDE